jgi:hypothetical protein
MTIKDEAKKWIFSLAILVFLMFIVFYKETFIQNIKTGLGIFYLFIFPGMPFSYLLLRKNEFLAHFTFSFIFGAAIFGLASYYTSLVGLNANYHHLYFPLIIAASGWIILYYKRKTLFEKSI